MADAGAGTLLATTTFFAGGVADDLPGLLLLPPPPAPPPPPTPDTTAPVVANVTPAANTEIEADTPVQFDVTDDSGEFHSLFVVASFPATGDQEVIHDGTTFAPRYVASSVRTVISGGFQYTVLRTGGWPNAPTIRVFPVDSSGNIST